MRVFYFHISYIVVVALANAFACGLKLILSENFKKVHWICRCKLTIHISFGNYFLNIIFETQIDSSQSRSVFSPFTSGADKSQLHMDQKNERRKLLQSFDSFTPTKYRNHSQRNKTKTSRLYSPHSYTCMFAFFVLFSIPKRLPKLPRSPGRHKSSTNTCITSMLNSDFVLMRLWAGCANIKC